MASDTGSWQRSHSGRCPGWTPGVRFISGHMGWETGSITEGLGDATGHRPCDRWIDVANALGVSLPVAQEFFRMHYPKRSEKLDNIEADLASIDKSTSVGVKTIALTYGNPTRRMREEGYWSWPVRILDNKNNEIGRISSEGTPSGDIKLLKRTKSSGHGGGYVSLMIAAPDNCRAEHGPAPHVVEETEEDRVKILSREQGNAMIKKLRL